MVANKYAFLQIAINGHIKFNLTIPLQQLNGLETLVIIMVANKYAFLQITRRRFLNEWEAFKKVISRRNIRRRITIPLTLSNLKLLRRITRLNIYNNYFKAPWMPDRTEANPNELNQDDARYGFRCCHLKNIWTAPLPPETELSRQMTTSTTSIDIMGLQAAYANLHTDQER